MNLIIPHLYLSDIEEARGKYPEYNVLNVMWDGEDGIDPREYHIATTVNDGIGETRVDVEAMNKAVHWMHTLIEQGEDVIVHCYYGIERSPLTVVWYLMKYRHMNLNQAYNLVMEKHPQTQYRGSWLPREVRLSGTLEGYEDR